MTREDWIRAGALYFPLAVALIAGLLRGRPRRLFAACLLGVLWVAPALIIVQRFNLLAGWWQFSDAAFMFRGIPLEFYLGWAVLWGILPHLAFHRLHVFLCAVIFVAADLILMPLCRPAIQLGPHWLIGEFVAVILVLAPGLCIGRWTLEDSHLRLRAAVQVAIAGMVFLYLVPEIAFALRPRAGWSPLLTLSAWQVQLALQGLALLAIPGVSAVMEFAERGCGTPIPYDPPKKLVVSGIYRYCANPMQVSCAIVMFGWAILLRNGWLLIAAAISGVYSAGIAEWDERQDLSRRFGDEWKVYRTNVKNWRIRWKPYTSGVPARLYIASTCGPCTELRTWIEARKPSGLEILAAETLPQGSIRRLHYDPADGSKPVEGIRALGRSLEHIHLAWALAGMTMRLPLLWQAIQLVMDASGLGPRTVQSTSCTAMSAARTIDDDPSQDFIQR